MTMDNPTRHITGSFEAAASQASDAPATVSVEVAGECWNWTPGEAHAWAEDGESSVVVPLGYRTPAAARAFLLGYAYGMAHGRQRGQREGVENLRATLCGLLGLPAFPNAPDDR